jgi:hypothetical protein
MRRILELGPGGYLLPVWDCPDSGDKLLAGGVGGGPANPAPLGCGGRGEVAFRRMLLIFVAGWLLPLFWFFAAF